MFRILIVTLVLAFAITATTAFAQHPRTFSPFPNFCDSTLGPTAY